MSNSKIATNVGIGTISLCSIGSLAYATNNTNTDIDAIKIANDALHRFISYNQYVTNGLSSKEKEISNIVDLHEIEADSLIRKLSLDFSIVFDGRFIPNKTTEERSTLFVSCKEFRELCADEKYEEAFMLEQKLNDSLNKEVLAKTISRVAFL